ncbi:MAG: DsrE family protein [Pseudomonadota bacterium]
MRIALPFRLMGLVLACAGLPCAAQSTAVFTTGPLLDDFGPAATVEDAAPIPAHMHLRVRFDISEGAKDDELNRSLVTAARFLNMHARAGVPARRMHIALVVHGRAVFDVLHKRTSQRAKDNAALVAALQQHDVRLYVCGQSAAYYEVTSDQLLPGVQMSLSAMTAHAVLAAEGYELNPF